MNNLKNCWNIPLVVRLWIDRKYLQQILPRYVAYKSCFFFNLKNYRCSGFNIWDYNNNVVNKLSIIKSNLWDRTCGLVSGFGTSGIILTLLQILTPAVLLLLPTSSPSSSRFSRLFFLPWTKFQISPCFSFYLFYFFLVLFLSAKIRATFQNI